MTIREAIDLVRAADIRGAVQEDYDALHIAADALDVMDFILDICNDAHAEDWSKEEQAYGFWQIQDEVFRWQIDNAIRSDCDD